MKKIISILIFGAILAACSPSQNDVQTAIVQTSIAAPTNTIESTETPIPLSSIDLEKIVFQTGDLPSEYVPGQFKDSYPTNKFRNFPIAQNFILIGFRNGQYASDGAAISLFNSKSDIDEAFDIITGALKNPENIDLGERGKYAGEQSTLLYVRSSTVVFVRCKALIHIQLFASDANLDTITAYAKRVDKRIKDQVCN